MARVVKATASDVRQRAATAREHLQVTLERLEIAVANPGPSAEAQVAASNAVVRPDGVSLSKKLARLLNDKSLFQYGTFCTHAAAGRACKDAQALVEALDSRNL